MRPGGLPDLAGTPGRPDTGCIRPPLFVRAVPHTEVVSISLTMRPTALVRRNIVGELAVLPLAA